MKKLTLAISAIAAAFGATAAKADVSVSGSGSAAYVNDMSSNAKLNVGQAVSFSMSTTTANGITISGGMGLTNTITTNAGQGVSGGQTLTFATGGSTIVVGDVEAGDTPGSVGGVVGGQVGDNGGSNTDVATGFADDDGMGLSLSTALGGSSLTIVYVANDGKDTLGTINSSTSGEDALTSASITVPMGMYTVTAGVADSDTGESASGASVAAALGGGTLTLGYSNQTIDNGDHAKLSTTGDTTSAGATYSMSLDAATTVAVGYNSAKDADSDAASKMELSIERSLGGGASVYLDMVNLSGDAATDGTALGFGTAVSF